MNVAGFRADVLDGPEALRRMADAYAAAASPLAALPLDLARRRLLFIGMGSSKYAADTAVALLRSRGLDAHSELASARLCQPPSAETVAFVISASGTSEETLAAMRRHLGGSLIVAVTNRPDGPLAAGADHVLPVLAGEEQGGIACKSYACTLAVLYLVAGRALGGDPRVEDIRAGADALAGLIDRRGTWVPALAGIADGGAGVWVSGPAERFGTVQQSALMLREAPRIVADACETGDWLHVDLYLTKRPGYKLLLLRGTPYDDEVMGWQRERGFDVVAVGEPLTGAALHVPHDAVGNAVARSLAETVVAELLAAELWERHPI